MHPGSELAERRGSSTQINELKVVRSTGPDKKLPVPTMGSKTAQSVEFPVSRSTEKRVPVVWRKRQNGSFGVPTVTNPDSVSG